MYAFLSSVALETLLRVVKEFITKRCDCIEALEWGIGE
jgi:hypothetical protein